MLKADHLIYLSSVMLGIGVALSSSPVGQINDATDTDSESIAFKKSMLKIAHGLYLMATLGYIAAFFVAAFKEDSVINDAIEDFVVFVFNTASILCFIMSAILFFIIIKLDFLHNYEKLIVSHRFTIVSLYLFVQLLFLCTFGSAFIINTYELPQPSLPVYAVAGLYSILYFLLNFVYLPALSFDFDTITMRQLLVPTFSTSQRSITKGAWGTPISPYATPVRVDDLIYIPIDDDTFSIFQNSPHVTVAATGSEKSYFFKVIYREDVAISTLAKLSKDDETNGVFLAIDGGGSLPDAEVLIDWQYSVDEEARGKKGFVKKEEDVTLTDTGIEIHTAPVEVDDTILLMTATGRHHEFFVEEINGTHVKLDIGFEKFRNENPELTNADLYTKKKKISVDIINNEAVSESVGIIETVNEFSTIGLILMNMVR